MILMDASTEYSMLELLPTNRLDCLPLTTTPTYIGVLGNGRAPPRRLAVPADILRLAELVLRQVVGTSVVRNAVAENPGVGRRGITPLTAFRAVGLATFNLT